MMTTNNLNLPVRDEMLSAKDIQKSFNVSRSTAYRVIQNGQLKTVRIGRSVRVSRLELIRFMRANDGELPTSTTSGSSPIKEVA